MKPTPKHTIVAASLSLCLAAPAAAQDDRSAEGWLIMARKGNPNANRVVCDGYLGGEFGFTKDLSKAFPFCKAHADASNDPLSQGVVGQLFRNGLGVAKDDAKAARYFRLAAEQGLASAQLALGYMHHQGSGVEKDLVEAREWYDRAAAQGNPKALAMLGNFHYRGLGGLPEDHARAAELYRRAADMGDRGAQANLAHLLEHGKGVPRDIEAAKRLYKQAAEQGDEAAAANYRRLSGQ